MLITEVIESITISEWINMGQLLVLTVTLLILIFQFRELRKSVSGVAYQNVSSKLHELDKILIENPQLTQVLVPEEIDNENQKEEVFRYYLINMFEGLFIDRKKGNLTRKEWRPINNYIHLTMTNDHFRDLWGRVRLLRIFDETFSKYLDKIIESPQSPAVIHHLNYKVNKKIHVEIIPYLKQFFVPAFQIEQSFDRVVPLLCTVEQAIYETDELIEAQHRVNLTAFNKDMINLLNHVNVITPEIHACIHDLVTYWKKEMLYMKKTILHKEEIASMLYLKIKDLELLYRIAIQVLELRNYESRLAICCCFDFIDEILDDIEDIKEDKNTKTFNCVLKAKDLLGKNACKEFIFKLITDGVDEAKEKISRLNDSSTSVISQLIVLLEKKVETSMIKLDNILD